MGGKEGGMWGRERGSKKEEKVKEGKRKTERKRMARDGEYMRGN